MQNCKNCNTEFDGNYCSNCGQRPNNGRIILKESVRDVLEHYFDFDAPLFRTIKGMVTNPGIITREYIFGKRKSYSHPFRYFILVLAVYIILIQLLNFNSIEAFSEAIGALELPNPNTDSSRASNFLREHINTFLLIYAFTLAFFAKLFNRKSGFYLVEYLSLSFFIIAEYILFSIFIILLTFVLPKIFLLNYLIVIIYPIYVLVRFHEGNLFMRLLKATFVSVFGWLTYATTSFTISFLIVKVFSL
tara:strand:+ start:54260 stop:55000 length:741 start_codon:yes stop_codon:yes gene_type:complete